MKINYNQLLRFFIFFSIISLLKFQSQAQGYALKYCDDDIIPSTPYVLPPGTNFIDFNGVRADEKIVLPPGASLSNCGSLTTGYFQLFFNDVHLSNMQGFDDRTIVFGTTTLGEIRRDIACQVYTYISSKINMHGSHPIVYFNTSINDPLNTSLGFASGFYPTVTSGGLPIESYLHQYITSLTATNPLPANYSHCEVTINFANRTYDGITYSINSSMSLPSSTQFDLFSIILHEATHTLDFKSLIDQTGNSRLRIGSTDELGPYSFFDKYLKIGTSNLVDLSGAFVGTTLNLVSDNLIHYKAGNSYDQVAVNSQNPYSLGTTLSHLDNNRNRQNYLMNGEAISGNSVRTYTSTEEEILCNIGYEVYGSTPSVIVCGDHYPVAYDDLTTIPYGITTATCIPVLINDIDLDMSGPGIGLNIIPTSVILNSPGSYSIIGNTICFTPVTGYCGGIDISYTIEDNVNHRISNRAHLVIEIPCTFCPDDPCNLVCNGDFEDGVLLTAFENPIAFPSFGDFITCPSTISNWCASSGTPDLFIRGSTKNGNSFNIPMNFFDRFSGGGVETHIASIEPNNRYSGGSYIRNLGPLYIEDISAPFTHDLDPTKTYRLDFWSYSNINYPILPNDDMILNVYISNAPRPFSGTDIGVSTIPSLQLISSDVIPLNDVSSLDNNWEHHVITGIIPTLSNARYIIFESYNPDLISSYKTYTYYDDVRFEEESNTLSITSSVSNANPHIGDRIEYTYRVCNTGLVPVYSATLNCTLPTGLTYVSGFSGITTHTIPVILPGECIAVILVADVNISAPLDFSINNCCTLPMSSCSGPGGSSTCNPIRVLSTDIAVYKNVLSSICNIGSNINYQIEIRNTGLNDANNIVVRDLLPTCLNFINYSSTPASVYNSHPIYNNITGDISVTNLNRGHSVYININATLNSFPCNNIVNLIIVDEFDINPINNNATLNITTPSTLSILTPGLTSTDIECGSTTNVHLVASYSGSALSYQWSTGETTPDILVVPSSTMNTYNLTVTDINGCIITSSIVFNVITPSLNLFTPNFSSHNICEGEYIHITSDYSSDPISYIWNTGETTSDIWVSPTSGSSNFSLTVTDINGCTSTSNINFIVGTKCCIDNSISEIGDNINSITNVSSLTSILGSTIFKLNGTLVINTNTTLIGKTFRMGPNAKIIINDGKQLNLTNCTLDACVNYMWDGIYINRVSSALTSLILTGTGTQFTTLKSAKNAVVSNNGGNYTINNNTMILSCYKGIVVNTTPSTHTGIIVNTTIDNTSNVNLLPPYETRTTTYKGIEINNVQNITIGDRLNSANMNMFNNADFGIYSFESNTNIFNNRFNRIFHNTAEPISGFGVYATKFLNIFNVYTIYKINVGGSINTTDINYFDNVDYGVYCKNTSADILGNNMTNLKTGVRLECDNRGRSSSLYANVYNVSRNYITAQDNGVFLNGNPFAIANVYYNFIYMPAGYALLSYPSIGSVGIRVADVLPTASAIIDINNNYVQDGNYGIHIMNNKNSVLTCNTIQYTYPTSTPYITGTGIFEQNSDKMKLYFNKINGNGINKRAGIQFAFSKANKIETNEVYNTKFGLLFDNDCATKGGINANKMVNNQYCLSLRSSGIIDAQITDGSKVPANEYTYPTGLSNYGTFSFSSYGDAYTFYVKNEVPSRTNAQNPDNNGYSGSGSRIVPQLRDLDKYTNPRNCILRRIEGEEVTDDELNAAIASMEAIAAGDIEVPVYNEMSQWTMAYKLYGELKADTTIKDSSEVLTNFYQNTSLNNIGKISNMHDAIADLDYSSIVIANTDLNPDNIIESNAKLLTELYLRTIALDNYNFDGEDISNLEYIANQCPFLGGLGVYQARAMLGYVYDNLIYDDNELCLLGSFKMAEDEEIDTNATSEKFQVYPNPAKDILNVYYANNIIADEIEIAIFDITGKKVLSKKALSNQLNQVDISLLSDAFYQIQIKDLNTLEVYNAKFMVSKK
ncbi:MAG: T9SS type A sorting domain-containing protein [Bacteroidota bacterium]